MRRTALWFFLSITSFISLDKAIFATFCTSCPSLSGAYSITPWNSLLVTQPASNQERDFFDSFASKYLPINQVYTIEALVHSNSEKA